MTATTLPEPFPTLLAGAIDYAGLFPPASLPMGEAVGNYARYRASEDRFALGRFIVPVAQLEEFLDATESIEASRWRVSLILGADPAGELVRVVDQEARARARGILLDSVEAKVTTPVEVERLGHVSRQRAVWYGEVSPAAPFVAVLDALQGHGGRAKLRMGGVVPEAFPESAVIARFLVALAVRNLPFKATAGLHHPVRGSFRLTYRPDAATGAMYGYLNLLAAVGLAREGATLGAIEAALLETDARRVLPDGRLGWEGKPFGAGVIEGIRRQFDGFGSCSFREPMDELPLALAR